MQHRPLDFRFSLSLCMLVLCSTEAWSQSQQRQPTGRPGTRQTPARGQQPTPAPPVQKATGQPKAAPTTSALAQTGGGMFDLRHKLKPGELLRTQNTHVVNTITRIQNVDDFSESKTVSDKVWEVKSVGREGNMTFEYRIEAVDMSQKKGDEEEVKYNSRTDKEVPKIFSAVAETISKPIVIVTMDAFGTVIDRDTKSKVPPIGMGELAMPLPKEPVALGAQWSVPHECRVKLEDGTQKSIKIREQYTLEKVSAGVATILVQSVPITPVEEPSVEVQLMQQMSRGTIKFDIDSGRMISKQLDWDEEIVGFAGPDSSLKYNARFTEEIVAASPQSASQAGGKATSKSASNPAAPNRSGNRK